MAGRVKKDRRSTTDGGLIRGRFGAEMDELVARLNASIRFDKRLAEEDAAGSIAHIEMLGEKGIVSQADVRAVVTALPKLALKLLAGMLPVDDELEDVHLHLESALIGEVGDAGRRLHTARSRNDQVATDLRLHLLRKGLPAVQGAISGLMVALVERASEHTDTLMPGYTHLQRAQPISLGHHLLAHVEAFDRDRQRLDDAAERVAFSPLGAAALAGTPFDIDRKATAKALGFSAPMRNSLDAVSARDFVLETLAALAIAMTHLSRLAEELVLWSTAEFGFVTLDDAYCSGSSIMPQKKNPDIPELCRAKAGRVQGNLMTLLSVLKGLPLAYNKDLQEDKEPLFDSLDTATDCFTVMAGVIQTATFHEERMLRALASAYPTATDAADYLVEQGAPFRDAHRAVGELVTYCELEGLELHEVDLATLRGFHPGFDEGLTKVLDPRTSLRRRDHLGGPSPKRVRAEVKRWKKVL
ncbi:MAG: argininosuccinate lyase [Deltaproteobacteria bacterium]|nr:argininosuccinate lyase [Deltaproteobacteria bacterium]